MKNLILIKKILFKIKCLLSNPRNGKRSYSQNGEDLMVSFIFAVLEIKNISYLDIGAFDPYAMSNTAIFYKNGNRGINIEPNPDLFKNFKKYRKKDKNLNIGIADKNGFLDYYVFSSLALNTFSKKEASKLEKETNKKLIKKISIEVKTIKEVVSKYHNNIFPDFLSIDTEGFEEKILKSIDYENNGPKVICAETISYSENNTGIKNTDLKSFLEAKGYMLFADTYINSIFVKKDLWKKKEKFKKRLNLYLNKYGTKGLLFIIARKTPTYLNKYIEVLTGVDFFDLYRKSKNSLLNLFSYKKSKIHYIEETKTGLKFPNEQSYKESLKNYLRKRQYFQEYLSDKKNDKKIKVDLNFVAYFQCYNQKKATFEVLKSFRKFFPKTPVYLLSDNGEDFSKIAKYFDCHYRYSEKNVGYWPCKDIHTWFSRLNNVCEKYTDNEWILLLEDDIKVTDYITKIPTGHLCGQGGGAGLKKGKQISNLAKEYLLKKNPDLEINGISGCGGSIFHRRTFIECYKHIDEYNVEKLKHLDNGLVWATDFAITFLFLMNGKLVRRWLDLSEETTKNFGPGSAFDHQFKKYYKKHLTDDDLKLINKI